MYYQGILHLSHEKKLYKNKVAAMTCENSHVATLALKYTEGKKVHGKKDK